METQHPDDVDNGNDPVSTLPIRNGNQPACITSRVSSLIDVSTLPIRNGNTSGFVGLVGSGSRKYLTYKEWKHNIQDDYHGYQDL